MADQTLPQVARLGRWAEFPHDVDARPQLGDERPCDLRVYIRGSKARLQDDIAEGEAARAHGPNPVGGSMEADLRPRAQADVKRSEVCLDGPRQGRRTS